MSYDESRTFVRACPESSPPRVSSPIRGESGRSTLPGSERPGFVLANMEKIKSDIGSLKLDLIEPPTSNLQPLTLGSLFSGIGGFELGFERTGKIQTIWQVEIDAYCRRVLAKHWPTVQRFADIRDCCGLNCCDPGRWRDGEACCKRKHHLRPVDILCGGFPCQDISNSGKRAGIDGERSGLWSEYARIIRELRPRYVVVENVAALLGRGMERVLGDLAVRGYDAEWQSIRASDVGAPHRRERIWIVAYPAESRRTSGTPGTSDARERCGRMQEFDGRSSFSDAASLRGPAIFGNESDGVLPQVLANAERDGRRKSSQVFRGRQSESALRRENVSDDDGTRFQEFQGQCSTAASSGRGIAYAADWWSTEPDVGRVAHGVPARVDRLRGLGNAIVPQIAEFIGHRIVADAFPSSRITLPSSGQATHESRITEVSA
jgi:DNA (cytosine-5)-methyltransferase 1